VSCLPTFVFGLDVVAAIEADPFHQGPCNAVCSEKTRGGGCPTSAIQSSIDISAAHILVSPYYGRPKLNYDAVVLYIIMN